MGKTFAVFISFILTTIFWYSVYMRIYFDTTKSAWSLSAVIFLCILVGFAFQANEEDCQ